MLMNNVGLSFNTLLVQPKQRLLPLKNKTTTKKQKKKLLNTDLDVDYHDNNQTFEAFGSALLDNRAALGEIGALSEI